MKSSQRSGVVKISSQKSMEKNKIKYKKQCKGGNRNKKDKNELKEKWQTSD